MNVSLSFFQSCNSSFHRGVATTGPPFTLDMLHASVQETASLGIRIHEVCTIRFSFPVV